MKCVTLVYNYVIWTHNYVFAFDWEHYPSDRGGGAFCWPSALQYENRMQPLELFFLLKLFTCKFSTTWA